jgi:hypothetical protein
MNRAPEAQCGQSGSGSGENTGLPGKQPVLTLSSVIIVLLMLLSAAVVDSDTAPVALSSTLDTVIPAMTFDIVGSDMVLKSDNSKVVGSAFPVVTFQRRNK